ncbi:MAG: 2-dehydropantoate 2-reductase [Deltaproteobacteria bacterium]|nr:MAG: 2-dehydropantoate 2-reductase [Deltaproteobacteria bacterium]
MSNSYEPKRIGVIGAGPVGCVVAAHLANGGYEVVLCDIVDALLAPARDPGIKVSGAAELTAKVAETITSVDDFAENVPDLIFVTSKATALPLIASAIQNFHKPGLYVVSWQNGIDTERVLAEYLGSEWVMRAIVNFGVGLPEPGHVHMGFHHPPHWIQELDEAGYEAADKVCEVLTKSGLETRHADRLIDKVWQKTILNGALSSVCAVTGKTMSGALEDPFLYEQIENLVKEGIAIARANEIALGWDYFRWAMNYLKSAGDHKPSMLVDIENKRMTEIEYINGQVVLYAKMAGVPSPYNSMIRAMVKALEP